MKSTVARSSPNPVLDPTLTLRGEEPIERLDRLAGGVHPPRDGQLPVLDQPEADQRREERSPPGAQKYHGAPSQASRPVEGPEQRQLCERSRPPVEDDEAVRLHERLRPREQVGGLA